MLKGLMDKLLLTVISLFIYGCSLTRTPSICCQIDSFDKLRKGTYTLQLEYSSIDIKERFLVQLEATEKRTILVAFTPLNTRWFSVEYQDDSYSSDLARFPPVPFNPTEIFCKLTLMLEYCQQQKKSLEAPANGFWHSNELAEIEIKCLPLHAGTTRIVLKDYRQQSRLTADQTVSTKLPLITCCKYCKYTGS